MEIERGVLSSNNLFFVTLFKGQVSLIIIINFLGKNCYFFSNFAPQKF